MIYFIKTKPSARGARVYTRVTPRGGEIKVIPRNLDELLTAILRPRSKDPRVWT